MFLRGWRSLLLSSPLLLLLFWLLGEQEGGRGVATGRGILQALPIGGPPTHIGGQLVLILDFLLFSFSLFFQVIFSSLFPSLSIPPPPLLPESSWESGATSEGGFLAVEGILRSFLVSNEVTKILLDSNYKYLKRGQKYFFIVIKYSIMGPPMGSKPEYTI